MKKLAIIAIFGVALAACTTTAETCENPNEQGQCGDGGGPIIIPNQ